MINNTDILKESGVYEVFLHTITVSLLDVKEIAASYTFS